MTRLDFYMQGKAQTPEVRILTITGDVRVACPSAPNQITAYVLEEQQDWFEDEIRFMRAIIEPDCVFIDVGANFGVYTLSAARLSPRGRVWAYEPAGATAACLTRSIAENRFGNVELTQKAVSEQPGSGWLQDLGAPELGMLGAAAGNVRPGEPITMTTLDLEQETHGWRRVDIVKIDVEGHEASVVAGGQRFFSEHSPLVMLEVKAGASVDLGAVHRLVDLGYRCWRLVPGLLCLAPQGPDAPMDNYLLNLFCCKPDREDLLARANRLARSVTGESAIAGIPMDAWQARIGAFPYARDALGAWTDQVAQKPLDGWDTYRDALNRHAFAMDPAQPIDARYDALRVSHSGLKDLLKTRANAPRLLSFARIAADFGARRQAVDALRFLIDSANGYAPADFLREPWLSPSSEFDAIAPHGALRDWALSAALEAYERLRSFSSYFVDKQVTLAVVQELSRTGYLTPAMRRRAELAGGRAP